LDTQFTGSRFIITTLYVLIIFWILLCWYWTSSKSTWSSKVYTQ